MAAARSPKRGAAGPAAHHAPRKSIQPIVPSRVSRLFEELAYAKTAMGLLSLRRRRELALDIDVYEIKLDDDFLMSSLFTASEIALARFGLAAVSGTSLQIMVGGLGLGYTARAALEDPRVTSMRVVDALAEVIEWHAQGLLPIAPRLSADPRCELVHADFFSVLDPESPDFEHAWAGRRFDAILLDIDHSPRHLLNSAHAGLYELAGIARLARTLNPGGVFALWSNDPPDVAFTTSLAAVFATSSTEIVRFYNHLQDRDATSTIYLATTSSSCERQASAR